LPPETHNGSKKGCRIFNLKHEKEEFKRVKLEGKKRLESKYIPLGGQKKQTFSLTNSNHRMAMTRKIGKFST